jgi:hypothetical protein
MSGIVLFDNFKLYKSKSNGAEEGGFYRYKDPESGKVSRCLVKEMNDESIAKEYIASNIAHLLMNERAPKVDLVFSKQNGTTVVRTASYLLDNFQTLSSYASQNGMDSSLIDSGYVIDEQGAISPLQAFSEGDLQNNENIKVFKPLGGAEDFLVVTEFLNHQDLHNNNRGVVQINGSLQNAIVDFSHSLFYNEAFRELLGFREFSNIEYYNLVHSRVTDKKKMVKAIELLVEKEEEILDLTSKLIYNLNLVGINSNAKFVKSNLKSKIAAFKSELQWLKVSLALEGEIDKESASQIFSQLENTEILDVSKETVRSVIEYAVKNKLLGELEKQCPEVAYYANYKDLVKVYKMKYDDTIKMSCDEKIRPFLMVTEESIEYAVQNNKHNILDVIVCNEDINDFSRVLEAAVKYDNAHVFDMFLSLIQKMKDDSTKDFVIESGPKVGNFPSWVIQRGVEYSIILNKLKFFNVFLGFCEGFCLRTALSSAISLGREEALKRIISEKLDLTERVTYKDGNNYVGMLIADLVQHKDTKILNYLLDSGLVLTTEEQDNISQQLPNFFNKVCIDNSKALIVPSDFEFVQAD